jgi:hypothetical protein
LVEISQPEEALTHTREASSAIAAWALAERRPGSASHQSRVWVLTSSGSMSCVLITITSQGRLVRPLAVAPAAPLQAAG